MYYSLWEDESDLGKLKSAARTLHSRTFEAKLLTPMNLATLRDQPRGHARQTSRHSKLRCHSLWQQALGRIAVENPG
eukprot:4685664-Amphidinium_carterae.1